MPDMSECRAIWAALELGGPRSLDDLEVTTGVIPEQSMAYLDLLMRHNYVRAVGVRRAGSGEAVPVFRLVTRTGPGAPYVDVWNRLVDPNQRGAVQTGKQQKSEPRKPSLNARVRVAAERLPSFTRAELLTAVFGAEPSRLERQWFGAAWYQMVFRGHAIAVEDGRFYLAPDIDPAVDSIRKVLKRANGAGISGQSMAQELGFSPTGPQMRHALDLLKAEGYGVTRHVTGGNKFYSVRSDLFDKVGTKGGTPKSLME
jgi:biotin operon repressor